MGWWDYLKDLWDLSTDGPIEWIIDALDHWGGVKLCKRCEAISPQICEVVNDKSVWFKNATWMKNALIIAAGVLGVVYLVGPALFFGSEILPSVGKLFTEAQELIFAPFKFVWWVMGWAQGWVIEFNNWLSEKLGIFPEILAAMEITGVVIGLTDLMLSLTDYALSQNMDSYFWRIFHALDTPLEWIQKSWLDLFPNDWNPLKWIIYPLIFAGKLFIFLLTPTLNLLNPLRWFQT